MTLLVRRISDHIDWNATSNNDGINSISPAFYNFPRSSSPSGQYVISSQGWDSSGISIADTQSATLIQNFDVGFSTVPSDYVPSVATFDSNGSLVDDDGSIWMASGEGGGEVFEFPLGQLQTPVYRFTMEGGDGGEIYSWTRTSRSFVKPNGHKVILIKEGGGGEFVYDFHLWDTETATYSRTVLTWKPMGSFQDDLGDIWLTGVDHVVDADVDTIHFKRVTDFTGGSTYTADLTFTGLPTITQLAGVSDVNIPGVWGCCSEGFFVGAWGRGSNDRGSNTITPMRTDYLVRLNLSDETDVTATDISGLAAEGQTWVIAPTPIPANPAAIVLAYATASPFSSPPYDYLIGTANLRKFAFFDPGTFNLTQSYDLNDWNAQDDLSSYVGDGTNPAPSANAYGDQYLYAEQAFIAQANGTGFYQPDNPDEILQSFGKLWIYSTTTDGGADEADEPTDDSPIIRVWGFSLDGHDFYVLRLGPSQSLIYDLMTGQWAEWATPNRDNWRAHCGQNWVGMSSTTFANGFGSDVVAGDDVSGTLWILDPNSGIDDRSTTGSDAFTRMVIGGIPLAGRDTLPCGAVQLSCSLGNPALTGASITLRTSDDFGNNYVNHGSVTTIGGTFDQVVEWRALGIIRQPGRVFELSDNGAAVRISGLDLR